MGFSRNFRYELKIIADTAAVKIMGIPAHIPVIIAAAIAKSSESAVKGKTGKHHQTFF